MTGIIIQPSSVSSGDMLAANNLSDVASAATSRTNLGLGTMATQSASSIAITGGTLAGLTGLALRDTSAAFDVTLTATSASALTAARSITLDVGNTSQTLKFTAASTVTFPSGTNTLATLGANTFASNQTLTGASELRFQGGTSVYLYAPATTRLVIGVNLNQVAQVDHNTGAGGFCVRSTSYLGWTPSTLSTTAPDVVLYRDAAATLAQRNATNAQSLKVYGTYTDASNYVRAAINTTSTTVALACETAGTGADNIDLTLTPAGTGVVQFGTHSALAAETVSGYITIKDSGGTTRKLAVVS